MYCTPEDVYRMAGITSTEISRDDIIAHIETAERDVDRLTNTTWWHKEYAGTVTSATSTTITITDASWKVNQFETDYVWIYGGTGSGQLVEITSNTKDTLTVAAAFDTTPDNTSTIRIIHTGSNPIRTEYPIGDGSTIIISDYYPIRGLVSITIDGDSATIANIKYNKETGEIDMSDDSSVGRWVTTFKDNVLTYWYGVWETRFDRTVRDLTAGYAAIAALQEQMGGTHNVPSSYSLPEGSVTIGQAYVNIKGTNDVLGKRVVALETKVPKFYGFA